MIKNLPWVSNLAGKIIRKLSKKPQFTTSGEYWEQRYQVGGHSGAGSYNNLAEFKAEVINNFLEKKNIDSVIEFGCGDGNQLLYLSPKNYIGYDVSKKAIELCRSKFEGDNTKTFRLMGYNALEKADLTLSLDVIYHLIEDHVFEEYMNKVFDSSNKYVIIYSSNTDKNELNAPHVKHRKYTDWVAQNKNSFQLIDHIPNRYPFNGNGENTSFADFFIYEKG